MLIVISDGADNASVHLLAQVLEMAEQSSAIIYAVGLFEPDDRDANPKVLSRLAKATGGEAFFPAKLSDVVEICGASRTTFAINTPLDISRATLDAEWRLSNGPGGGAGAGKGKLVVRTRAGYIARVPAAVEKGVDSK